MRHTQRIALIVILLGLFGFAMAACNTTEGFGRDVESAGEGIQDAAD